ncbi:MAG: hypothetical protein ACK4UV_06545, partial [Ignavibacterium sp.]
GIAFNPPVGGLHEICEDYLNCFQYPDNSNCTECGDRVCDTPPDPCLYGKVDNNCNAVNLPPGYLPDTRNIMSYSRISCYEYFSTGQFQRMNTVIDNSTLLQNCIIQTVDFVLDQKLKINNNWVTSGKVYRWLYNNFEEKDAPQVYGFIYGQQECLKNQQEILQNQKFQKWNQNNNELINHYSFTFNSTQLTSLTGYFDFTIDNVVIRNTIDKMIFNDSIPIYFKDPWLIDFPDPLYGNSLRNRGMDAPFKKRPSPFYPDYTTSYNGDVYKGVFLNQGEDWLPPYYSVKADYVQDISLQQTGRTHKFYFQRWDASPQGSAIFRDTNAVETPVVFNQPNATVQANLEL